MDKVQLNYAKAAPKTRWKFALISALGLLAAVILGPSIDRMVRRRIPFLLVQRRCEKFTLPSTTNAYEEDHLSATRISGGKTSGDGWTTLSDQAGNIEGFYLTPKLLNEYHDPESGFSLFPQSNFLFLHSRRAKGGEDRLIYVGVNNIFAIRAGSDTDLAPGTLQARKVLDWQVIEPASLFSAPRTAVKSGSWGDASIWINMPKPLRIYAGQADPLDESHFTFSFVTPRRTWLVEGWLQPDDTLIFSEK